MVTKAALALLIGFAGLTVALSIPTPKGPQLPTSRTLMTPKMPPVLPPPPRPGMTSNLEQASSRIVGGADVTTQDFPWMTWLAVNNAAWCGGSILDKHWILTTAGCVYWASYVWIIAGSRDLYTAQETQVQLYATELVLHEGYQGFENDVALLRVEVPIPFTSDIGPATLPAQGAQDLPGGEMVRPIGWGFTSTGGYASYTLRYVDVPMLARKACETLYGPEVITNSIVCTNNQGGKGVCDGDFGGPLNHKGADGKWVVRGLSAFLAGAGCESGLPQGFTNVAQHVDWIKGKIGKAK